MLAKTERDNYLECKIPPHTTGEIYFSGEESPRFPWVLARSPFLTRLSEI